MDKNSASLNLSSFIAVGSYSQISEVHVTLYSSNVKERLIYLGHVQKPTLRGNFSEINHFRSVQFLASFISTCFDIYSYLV